MAKLLVLHGPNLNLLGSREPEIYGYDTLDDINQRLEQQATAQGHHLACLQSNAEHQLVDALHQAKQDGVAFVVINPGAFTHTSIALRDAFLGVELPFIEVHLSNVHAREDFRSRSLLSGVCIGVVCGFGITSYKLAIDALLAHLDG